MLKNVWICSGFDPLLGSILAPGSIFSLSVFNVFWKIYFSNLGRLLEAKGAQKATKMKPKWSPKEAWGYPLGSEKTMVFTVREAYEGDSGRLWETTFSCLRLQILSGELPGSICTDFHVFRCPGGSIEAPFEVTSGT